MISSFEDLIVWQKAMAQVQAAEDLLKKIETRSELTDQLFQYALHVPARIADGFVRSSRMEFRRHLQDALGAQAAFRTILYLIERREPDLREPMITMQRQAADIQHQTLALVFKLKNTTSRKKEKAPPARAGAENQA